MALMKLADYYPDYKQDIFGGDDIKGYEVYSESNEKVGSVHDALVDDSGRFRYLILDTGFWVFGKKVLIPVGQVRMDYDGHRVYVRGVTKQQVENLPEYRDDMTVDYDYEEQVRGVYRPATSEATTVTEQPLDPTYTAGMTAGMTGATTGMTSDPAYVADTTPATTYDRDTYTYDREPTLYQTNEQDHKNLKLYEERLFANKNRVRTGEVVLGKHVETETANVSVPLERERIVIERTSSTDTQEVAPGDVDFAEGEVARMEVYEEEADIQKRAFVREEVGLRKEIDRETVEASETLRREELDVTVDGNPMIDKRPTDI